MRKLLLLLALLIPVQGAAAPSFQLSNDFFIPSGQDRYLTNLVGYNYSLDDRNTVGLWNEMRTPDNLRVPTPDEGDAPYSGYTYLTYIKKNPITEDEFRRYEYRVGLLGHASGTDELQKFIHNTLDMGVSPKGWDSQAQSALAIDFIYSHNNEDDLDSWVGDTKALNSYGVRLGNVVVEAFLNQRVQKDFWDIVRVYGSVAGHAQVFNTHYQGRMFQSNSDIYTVDTIPFWSAATGGIEFNVKGQTIGFSYTYETRQFSTQEDDHIYGTIYFIADFFGD